MSKTGEPSTQPNIDSEYQEPTIDWLIDELVPNRGNSPLINFNKQRLRDLIHQASIASRIDELKRAKRQSYITAPVMHRVDRRIASLEGELNGKV